MIDLLGVLVQVGAIVAAAGLFLLITPFAVIGLLLLFLGTIVACLSWGAARSRARPASVAIVGGFLTVFGVYWMCVFYAPWTCFGSGTCYSWLDVVANPLFELGMALAGAGIALVGLSAVGWLRDRRARSSRVQPRLAAQ